MGVGEDFRAVGDGEGRASAGGGAVILLFEQGDGWAGVSLAGECLLEERGADVLPMTSTMPVNMFRDCGQN